MTVKEYPVKILAVFNILRIQPYKQFEWSIELTGQVHNLYYVSVVCSEHLTKDCFEKDTEIAARFGIRLVQGTIPIIFKRPANSCSSSLKWVVPSHHDGNYPQNKKKILWKWKILWIQIHENSKKKYVQIKRNVALPRECAFANRVNTC